MRQMRAAYVRLPRSSSSASHHADGHRTAPARRRSPTRHAVSAAPKVPDVHVDAPDLPETSAATSAVPSVPSLP